MSLDLTKPPTEVLREIAELMEKEGCGYEKILNSKYFIFSPPTEEWIAASKEIVAYLVKLVEEYRKEAIKNWQPTVTVYPLDICPFDRDGKVDEEVRKRMQNAAAKKEME